MLRIDTLGRGAREDWTALWAEAFPGDDPAWIEWYADSFAKPASILGAWEGIRLVGTVHMNRCSLFWGGREIPSCAVAGVATAKDRRGSGIARQMMEETHRILRAEGVPLAYLYPFHYPFYEKFGWQAGYRARNWDIAADRLLPGEGTFAWAEDPGEEEFRDMARLYRSWTAGYGGYRLRDASYMARLWQDAASDGCRLGFRTAEGRRGYVLASEADGVLRVQDWADADMAGLMGCALRDTGCMRAVWMAPEDTVLPGAECTTEDRDMVRILDFAGLLDGMHTSAEGCVTVAVEDAFLPENTLCCRIRAREGRISCSPSTDAPRVTGDIRAWTRFWMGYASADEAGLTFADKNDTNTAALLTAMRPQETLWLREMYV